ncbi:MAG TPA: chemotaxis protein CheW [Xanthomonadaceae bacterium]|jgi:chemotaxis-related protein WspB|nr:chemotaxis protein CheW [Xanthomonadaceae bacterium]
MLALAFRAGELRLALPTTAVIKVLPRRALRALALAPDGVIGLLPFRGTLTPVVDLCQLLLGRECAPLRSSRIIVMTLPGNAGSRLLGLLAEDVLDLLPVTATVPGLRLPNVPWLSEYVADQPDLPQLLDPAALLPERLEALFVAQADA